MLHVSTLYKVEDFFKRHLYISDVTDIARSIGEEHETLFQDTKKKHGEAHVAAQEAQVHQDELSNNCLDS